MIERMKRRVSYYVSRKNVFTWLAALILTASAVLRIAYPCEKGAGAATVWFQIVLPVAACLIYVLILLCSGEERFYRTAIPTFLLAIYYGIKISMSALPVPIVFVFWVAYLAIAAFYAVTVSGHVPNNWFLVLLLAAALGVLLYTHRAALRAREWTQLQKTMPDMLFLLGGLLTTLAMQIHLDGKYHPAWGDRPDGRKLRTIDPMQTVANYIMPNRVPASNCIRDTIEITAMERYIRQKRKEGLAGFGIMHVFLAAYVRVVAKYPAVNRFLSGQQVYSRDDDIQFCLTVKLSMSTDAAESIAKIHLKPTDTAYDVYEKLNKAVADIQGHELGSDFDKTAKVLSLIPGVLFKFVVWLLKLIDYFGLLPKFLLEVSPFHGSIFFTSMGSLGIPPIVHHLYDFGNLPVFVSFGCKYRKNEIEDDGTVVAHKYVDYTVNTDERICDGFYFATTMKYMKRLMAHPERLDIPPEEVVRDID